MTAVKAPFPWFGGKSRAAPLVWEALGDVENYVEPFAGSLAVLLGRPHAPHVETVNDLDCYLANFWRSVQADPKAVAKWAAGPVHEADLHARHAWLKAQIDFRERMFVDPSYFDAQIAGWWVWGCCAWVGDGWMRSASRPLPELTGSGGKGVHRKTLSTQQVAAWLDALSARLERVRVASGDWSRVLSPAVLRTSPLSGGGIGNGHCGVLLDPPYEQGKMAYAAGAPLIADVREWAIAHGNDPHLRIVLCGYEGEHAMPDSWRKVEWKAHGGYGSQGKGAARENKHRERLWLSPACLPVASQVAA